MKKKNDAKHTDKSFEIGEFVYLRLQPYRQLSISLKRKLSVRFYGPFEIIRKVGAVAYKLKVPKGSKIHPVFHVSLLKKRIGSHTLADCKLPIVPKAEDSILPMPQAILDWRARKKKDEVLVHWQGLSPAEATWESVDHLRRRFPDFHP